MIVKLLEENPDYPDLTPNQPYFVIGIEADDYRILNDHGKPYLYRSRLFKVIDSNEPNNWITEYGDDGERYSYPPELNEVGFFEDYFDWQKEELARRKANLMNRPASGLSWDEVKRRIRSRYDR
jgi:hypothetical protein